MHQLNGSELVQCVNTSCSCCHMQLHSQKTLGRTRVLCSAHNLAAAETR